MCGSKDEDPYLVATLSEGVRISTEIAQISLITDLRTQNNMLCGLALTI